MFDLHDFDIPNEFDYQFLLGILAGYEFPRDKIGKLLRDEHIIRIKKGIYVLGERYKRPFSKFILANMIYGPSYISGYSALAYYGLIPERVDLITSTTCNRIKKFDTVVGRFEYSFLNRNRFYQEVTLQKLDHQRSFMIASPEKALVEVLIKVKGIDSLELFCDWLDSTRIDYDSIQELRSDSVSRLMSLYNKPEIGYLFDLIEGKAKDA